MTKSHSERPSAVTFVTAECCVFCSEFIKMIRRTIKLIVTRIEEKKSTS